MKIIVYISLIFIASLSTVSCAAGAPSSADMVGTWVSQGGSKIILHNDSRIEMYGVPDYNIRLSTEGKIVNTSGSWRLSKNYNIFKSTLGPYWWDLELHLLKIDDQDDDIITQIYYSFENNSPILFLWAREEGGDRIIFYRQKFNVRERY